MKKRKKMLILCPYPRNTGAGQRLKYEAYIPDWEALGWQVTVSNFMSMSMFNIAFVSGRLFAKGFWTTLGFVRRLYDLLRIWRYDIVYIYLWATPFGGKWYEKLVRWLAPALIYDIEDNVLMPPASAHPLVPKILAPLMDRTAKIRFLARSADIAIIASPFLLEPLNQVRRKGTILIPPSIDMDRMKPRPEKQPPNPVPVIGWTGTFGSKVYLDMMAAPLLELSQTRAFIFKVISNFEYSLPGVNLEVVRWSEAREVEDLQSLDIGVYPLVDDDWTRGKAGLKIIQYQAVGIPCVASDVPLSRLQITQGKTGLLVSRVEDWVAALECLIDDVELRRSIGAAGREDAMALYSRAVVKDRYREALVAAQSREG